MQVKRWKDAHSPTLPLHHLFHSSFSNSSIALPTSQLILQPFRCFTYVTADSATLLQLHLRHRLFTYVTWRTVPARLLYLQSVAARGFKLGKALGLSKKLIQDLTDFFSYYFSYGTRVQAHQVLSHLFYFCGPKISPIYYTQNSFSTTKHSQTCHTFANTCIDKPT